MLNFIKVVIYIHVPFLRLLLGIFLNLVPQIKPTSDLKAPSHLVQGLGRNLSSGHGPIHIRAAAHPPVYLLFILEIASKPGAEIEMSLYHGISEIKTPPSIPVVSPPEMSRGILLSPSNTGGMIALQLAKLPEAGYYSEGAVAARASGLA